MLILPDINANTKPKLTFDNNIAISKFWLFKEKRKLITAPTNTPITAKTVSRIYLEAIKVVCVAGSVTVNLFHCDCLSVCIVPTTAWLDRKSVV